MPSARYYRQQAQALLSWAEATMDRAYAAWLRQRAAEELDQAAHAPEDAGDLNPLLSEFNDRQMAQGKPVEPSAPHHGFESGLSK
jgi:hypothetical protein